MSQPARLNAALLARKGDAAPTSSAPYPRLDTIRPLGANRARCGTPIYQESADPRPRRTSDRVGLTVRLDRDRYTRLKIFAARHGDSAQHVLLEALDAHLEACAKDCDCLRSPKARGGN